MLSQIYIKDFAIIDEQELELGSGMSALTGETGAGKSILLDAIGLTLGDRADSDAIRAGVDKSEISVSFDITDCPDASTWLRDNDLDAGNECQLRRIITAEGRSRAYINGRPATLQLLRELGERLIDIHGQHEHQSLMKRDIQRKLLDDFAGNHKLLDTLAGHFRQWQQLHNEFEQLRSASQERQSRLELLQFQVKELDELDLQEDEITKLGEEHKRLANAGQLLDICQQGLATLYDADEGTVRDQLNRVQRTLEDVGDIDATLNESARMINEALINVEEATDTLRRFSDSLELDPSRLQWVEDRLALIHELARKHHVMVDELPALHASLQLELDNLDHADERLESLQAEVETQQKAYRETAASLGKERRKAASRLDKAVSKYLDQLGMKGARFEVSVETDDNGKPGIHGLDRIEYLVSANPGQPPKPITRIASGGELSRISLAIQVVLAANTRIPTLIYDEVDTGIGGGIAEVVGRLLRELGGQRQVLCVTHLPQVAAQAHHHLLVSKQAKGKQTHTRVDHLSDEERAEELARMLGGVEITEQTRAHAQEMLERAKLAS
jgi:DNA repair protein RecN (Recombination protein N)